MHNADVAMYPAKDTGGRKLQDLRRGPQWAPARPSVSIWRHGFAKDKEHDEIDVHYQPGGGSRNRRVVGAEALVRGAIRARA